MNMPAVFAFNAAAVRVFTIQDAPWFVAMDVAGILGYRDAEKMTRMLDEDEADTHNVGIRSENGVIQDRSVSIINESGLYACILKSRRPEAKTFRKWVTSEVLPSIRAHGSYGMPRSESVSRDEPLSLSHRADILVSADRTFRAALRSGRSAGLRMTQALRRANEIALQNTGINMLAALQAEDIAVEPAAPIKRDYGIPSFLAEWKDGRLPVPHCICRSSAFYDAYVMWCGENDANPARITQFAGLAQRANPSLEKFITGIPVDGGGMHSVRVIVPQGARAGQESGEWTRHVASECTRFAVALAEWKDAA